jgi:hypothetical protein
VSKPKRSKRLLYMSCPTLPVSFRQGKRSAQGRATAELYELKNECSLHLNFSFAAQLQIYTFILYRRNIQERKGTTF